MSSTTSRRTARDSQMDQVSDDLPGNGVGDERLTLVVPNVRGYNGGGPQHFGTSPQQVHQYMPQQRSGSNSYNNSRSYSSQSQNQGQGQGPQATPAAAAGAAANPGRSTEGTDEAK